MIQRVEESDEEITFDLSQTRPRAKRVNSNQLSSNPESELESMRHRERSKVTSQANSLHKMESSDGEDLNEADIPASYRNTNQ